MASLNKTLLIGRLGRDPELKYTQGGQAVCNFSMATDESYTGKDGQKVDRAEWHNIVAWGKTAEACANYLHKGSLVFVEGKLQTRKWQDQQGANRFSTEIVADKVQFLDQKPAQGGHQGRQDEPRQQGGYQSQGQRRAPVPMAEPEDLGPAFPSEASGMDEVPFMFLFGGVAALVWELVYGGVAV